jgi:hypothetical protein
MPTTTIFLALVFAQATLTGLPGPNSKESAELRATLRAPVQSYDVRADTFVNALIDVAGQFKFPIGIAWVRAPSELKPIRLSWSDATVEQVVRDIVHAQPGYEVEVRNAVVHVRPRDMVSSKESFLGLRISRFEVQNEVAETASKKLGALANLEVTPPKPPAGQAKGGVLFEQGVEVGDPEISIGLADVTVEEALDAISLVSPFKVWLVTFEANNNLTPGGFRRTLLASGRSVPDEYEPVWELLRWGRTPY